MVSIAPRRPVYLITHEFFPQRGGIATFTEEIARATAALGYPMEVWAPNTAGEQDKVWPFKVRRLHLAGTHSLSCQVRLARHLIATDGWHRHHGSYADRPGC